MQVLSSGFLGATPDFWCQVDELVSANWTAEQIKNFSSPGKFVFNDKIIIIQDVNWEASIGLVLERIKAKGPKTWTSY